MLHAQIDAGEQDSHTRPIVYKVGSMTITATQSLTLNPLTSGHPCPLNYLIVSTHRGHSHYYVTKGGRCLGLCDKGDLGEGVGVLRHI